MKFLLSIILFIGYWFITTFILDVILGLISVKNAADISMLLAVPLGFIAAKKTINKVFKNQQQPIKENEKEEVAIEEEKKEGEKEKNPEYSYVKPKKPSEKYLEKLKNEGKSPTPEADKIKQKEIKEKVLNNIKKFREETYKEDSKKEIFSLTPDITVEIEVSPKLNNTNNKNNRNKDSDKKATTEPDLVLPFTLETEILNKKQPIIKFLHIDDAPKSLKDLIQLLIDEGYIFNREKWELADSEFNQLRKRLLQLPMPDKYHIQNLIEKLRMEKFTIFLSENYLKTVPAYQLGQFIKQTTEQFLKEGRSVEEFLDVINSYIPDEILTNDNNIAQYLKEMEKAVNPTKRQRIKGLDRVNHYWKYFVYNIQLEKIQDELNLIKINIHILEVHKSWQDNDFLKAFRFDTTAIPLFFNIGFGENIIPKYIYPLIINPLAGGYLTPIFE